MAKSRNPYHNDKGIPQLKASVFAFIDILGYASLTKKSQQDNTQAKLLRELYQALSEGRGWLEEKKLPGAKKLGDRDFYVLKAFSDNIVIAWPIRDDAELELGLVLSKITDFQFTMACAGFFIRGSISVGQACVDDILVFGDALTQAYVGESQLARDPRIVLVESAVMAVKQHLTYYGNGEHSPQNRALLCDSDGQWFVNYLDCILYLEEEVGPDFDALLSHKAAVEEKLKQYRDDPPIFSKYAWVAGYHNFFCDKHSRHFSDQHKIQTELFKAPPRSIVAEG